MFCFSTEWAINRQRTGKHAEVEANVEHGWVKGMTTGNTLVEHSKNQNTTNKRLIDEPKNSFL